MRLVELLEMYRVPRAKEFKNWLVSNYEVKVSYVIPTEKGLLGLEYFRGIIPENDDIDELTLLARTASPEKVEPWLINSKNRAFAFLNEEDWERVIDRLIEEDVELLFSARDILRAYIREENKEKKEWWFRFDMFNNYEEIEYPVMEIVYVKDIKIETKWQQ